MTTAATRYISMLFAIGLTIAIAGCDAQTDDLAAFVAQTQTGPPQPIEPMPKIAAYQPDTFQAADRRSPFESVRQTQSSRDTGVRPNRDRELEPLEQYPLDALQMVGTIASNGVTYALIKAPDQVVHRLGPGRHIGRHYGRIDAIDADGLTVTEIVSDRSGGYVERRAVLAAP